MSRASQSSLESFLVHVDRLDRGLIFTREDRLKVKRLFNEYGDRVQEIINVKKAGRSDEREQASRYQFLYDTYGKPSSKPILGAETTHPTRREERQLRDFELSRRRKPSLTFHPASPVIKLVGYGITIVLTGLILYGGWQIAKYSRFFFESIGKKYNTAIEQSKEK
jgi:hypothetical protein